jgi:hypothetical protein
MRCLAVFGVGGSVEIRKLMTKIPAKLFNDFQTGGGLCIILTTALKYKKELVHLQQYSAFLQPFHHLCRSNGSTVCTEDFMMMTVFFSPQWMMCV